MSGNNQLCRRSIAVSASASGIRSPRATILQLDLQLAYQLHIV
jgi:hypothetical protein